MVFLYWVELNIYSIYPPPPPDSKPYTNQWNKFSNGLHNYQLFITQKKWNTPDPLKAQIPSAVWNSETCVIYPQLGICPGMYTYFTIYFFSQSYFFAQTYYVQ